MSMRNLTYAFFYNQDAHEKPGLYIFYIQNSNEEPGVCTFYNQDVHWGA